MSNFVSSITSNLTSYSIEPMAAASTPLCKESQHTAQRGEWLNYGNESGWNVEFEKSVNDAVTRIRHGELTPKSLISHLAGERHRIALKRENPNSEKFGARRDECPQLYFNEICYTPLRAKRNCYGYALPKAIKIEYDGNHYVDSIGENGVCWYQYLCDVRQGKVSGFENNMKCEFIFRYGLVQGFINQKSIPLTQYVFCPRVQPNRNAECEAFFDAFEESYIGENEESAIWLHTSVKQIEPVLSYIETLVDRAMKGDLTVIPRVHWWYVHLAPTWRGSGGIAEMLVHTLCKLHGHILLSWKEEVAPSVETLLEPNEQKYCTNYYKLFENGNSVKSIFSGSISKCNNPEPRLLYYGRT